MTRSNLTITASGKWKSTFRGPWDAPLEIHTRRVSIERIDALHRLLVRLNFCALQPKKRQDSPDYTIVEAAFPDLTCSVELPYDRWKSNPKARAIAKAIDDLSVGTCLDDEC